jgi:hypothetical protein
MRRRKPPEPIRLDGVVGIPLTRNKTAWVDAADYPLVADHIWYAMPRGQRWYAVTHIGKTTKTMQDVIMSPAKGLEIDHRCGESLWNMRWNLRELTHSENMRNSRRCIGGKCEQRMREHEVLSWEEKLAAAEAAATIRVA